MGNKQLSILIIDAEITLSLSVMRCLASVPQIKTHILSNDRWAVARFSRHCASFHYYTPTHDDDLFLDEIGKVARYIDADIILPVFQDATKFSTKHTRTLEKFAKIVSIPKPEIFNIAVDKWLLADFMRKYGISTPTTVPITKSLDFKENLAALTYPVLAKPRHGSAGSGIREIKDYTELERFIEMKNDDASSYIIQNRIRGYDIDCSVLCREGEILAYTIQKGIIPNPIQFRPPLAIEFLHHDEVLMTMSKLVAELNWNGVAHVDMMLDADDQCIKVIDFNARYWESLLGSLAVGVNFPYLACLDTLNRSLPPSGYQCRRYIAPNASSK